MKYLQMLICVSAVFAPLSLSAKEERSVGEFSLLRPGIWGSVPWKGTFFSGEILEVQEKTVTVKIFDLDLSVFEWPVATFSIEQVKPYLRQKYANLEDLLEGFKQSNQLKTPIIAAALSKIDRAWFCPERPYEDTAIDIGHNMVISSPHMHVLSLELLKDFLPNATSILDVGLGSGYLTALFSELSPNAEVTGIEYFEDLATLAQEKMSQHLSSEAVSRIQILHGDGRKGVFEKAPYSIIYVGFMCNEIPKELIAQLKPGGRMLIPVGSGKSPSDSHLLIGNLIVVDKLLDGSLRQCEIFPCVFVPALG